MAEVRPGGRSIWRQAQLSCCCCRCWRRRPRRCPHRLFSASMGGSMSDYVRDLRLKRAGYKLRMGAVDITEVALAAGYQTHAAFGKAFKQQYGLSPSDFRDLTCQEATQRLMKGTKC